MLYFSNDLCFSLTVCMFVNLSAVKMSVRVKHFKVHTANETNFYIQHNLQVTSLIDLVEHYCANDLNNTGTLGNPCKRVGGYSLYLYCSSFLLHMRKQEVWTQLKLKYSCCTSFEWRCIMLLQSSLNAKFTKGNHATNMQKLAGSQL